MCAVPTSTVGDQTRPISQNFGILNQDHMRADPTEQERRACSLPVKHGHQVGVVELLPEASSASVSASSRCGGREHASHGFASNHRALSAIDCLHGGFIATHLGLFGRGGRTGM